jgi:hypothetical protein
VFRGFALLRGRHGYHLNLSAMPGEPPLAHQRGPGACSPRRAMRHGDGEDGRAFTGAAAVLAPDLRRLDPYGFTTRGYRPGCPLKVALGPHPTGEGTLRGRRKLVGLEAYSALDAIRRGYGGEARVGESWLKAFRAVGWLVDAEAGPVLTDAGLRALDELIPRKIQAQVRGAAFAGPARWKDPDPS